VQQLPGPDESNRVSPYVRPAPQPQVTSITGSALLQADHSAMRCISRLAARREDRSRMVGIAPNSFTVSTAKDFSTDLTAASDGTMFAIRSGGTTEFAAPI